MRRVPGAHEEGVKPREDWVMNGRGQGSRGEERPPGCAHPRWRRWRAALL